MGLQTRTIAIIDDDLRVLDSLVNLLAAFGFKADSYSSAEQFLGSACVLNVRCIITDVEMRPMSGLDLLLHLKKVNSTIPVIVITGKPSGRSEDFYLEKGAAGFFRKPVNGDALLELVNTVCADISQDRK